MLGVDVLHLGLMAFTDQKLFQAFATSRIQPRLHLVADVGYERNKYDKTDTMYLLKDYLLKPEHYIC